MIFEPIKAPNLADAAADQIRTLIAQDVLRPGDQLPSERDLCKHMGISRTSLRAALQTLVAEGFLTARHGRGFWVSEQIGASLVDPLVALIESSPQAVSDYMHFRIMHEGECAAIAAERATTDELEQIQLTHDQMVAAHKANDREREIALDTEFHMAIVEATGNVVTIQVARSLHALLQQGVRRHHGLAYEDPAHRDALMDQHASINDAIQKRDPRAARQAMHDHLSYFDMLLRQEADKLARKNVVKKRRARAS